MTRAPLARLAALAMTAGLCPAPAQTATPAATAPGSEFFTPPAGTVRLEEVAEHVPDATRALVIIDPRLHALAAPALHAYVDAAAKRRRFRITVLPIEGVDDLAPPALREAMQQWHAKRPGIEGVLLVGNIKLPSFFMPRPDIHSTRLWPRFYEDLDMRPARTIVPGTILREDPDAGQRWPRIAGVASLNVPRHDYDFLSDGPSPGPEWWTAFLPVGFQNEAQNSWPAWAEQLAPFFKKAEAFHTGTTVYDRGLYLVSNDASLLARSRPVWDAVGPRAIEFYAVNEKGPGAFKNNPAGYQRAALDAAASLEAFLEHAGTLPWMDEGWQSPAIFLEHMAQSRRRIVWWNVHSNPGQSLVSWQQARDMREGGLIALLNGCSVGGFRQPGSHSEVNTETFAEQNVMTNIVYGRSAFVAALGSTHDRVTDEHGTPLLARLYDGGYLGRAHLERLRQADQDVHGNPMQLREFQEILIGDPFADAR